MSNNISKELKIAFLEKMYTIRRFEEKVRELFSLGLIRGSTHVYIGEEAVIPGEDEIIDNVKKILKK